MFHEVLCYSIMLIQNCKYGVSFCNAKSQKVHNLTANNLIDVYFSWHNSILAKTAIHYVILLLSYFIKI